MWAYVCTRVRVCSFVSQGETEAEGERQEERERAGQNRKRQTEMERREGGREREGEGKKREKVGERVTEKERERRGLGTRSEEEREKVSSFSSIDDTCCILNQKKQANVILFHLQPWLLKHVRPSFLVTKRISMLQTTFFPKIPV